MGQTEIKNISLRGTPHACHFLSAREASLELLLIARAGKIMVYSRINWEKRGKMRFCFATCCLLSEFLSLYRIGKNFPSFLSRLKMLEDKNPGSSFVYLELWMLWRADTGQAGRVFLALATSSENRGNWKMAKLFMSKFIRTFLSLRSCRSTFTFPQFNERDKTSTSTS